MSVFLASRRFKRFRDTRSRHRDGTRSDRLRVALVFDTIESWAAGGTEKYLLHLLDALDRQYFDPRLILLQRSPTLTQENVPCDLRVMTQDNGKSRGRLVLDLVKEFKEFQPHVVQTYFRDGTYYGTVAACLAGVPVVINSERNLGHWHKTLDRFVLHQLRHFVDGWQCNSQAVWQWLSGQRGKPLERIDILPNVIDIGRFSPCDAGSRVQIRQCLGFNPGQLVIVNVSNLRPVKSVVTMIDAAARVLSAVPHVRFVVIGDGPERDALLRRIAELRITKAFHLIGGLNSRHVLSWLSAADIGLLTSQSEGSSNSVLEYMAMGLPAVLSDIPANLELVDGVFFRTGDPNDLAEKILDLWADTRKREAMGRTYRQKAMQYSVEQFAERVQAFYFGIIAGSP